MGTVSARTSLLAVLAAAGLALLLVGVGVFHGPLNTTSSGGDMEYPGSRFVNGDLAWREAADHARSLVGELRSLAS